MRTKMKTELARKEEAEAERPAKEDQAGKEAQVFEETMSMSTSKTPAELLCPNAPWCRSNCSHISPHPKNEWCDLPCTKYPGRCVECEIR